MAFWYRINRSMLAHFASQLKRRKFQVPHTFPISHKTWSSVIGVSEKPVSAIYKPLSEFCVGVRFFAAPVQAKPKKEVEETSGPRLNHQITVPFVRLVTEEGHDIVSRNEALEHARKLNLDLVEVQRNANPPVCKIMDFHKEKYKQQLKEKERSKSKSETTLRKGDCKEVRFTGKIEEKDLKIKADTATRLMERGYRVKCMAMGNEGEDLAGLLSRFSPLVADVAFVESGPRVEKKQAYIVIRHIKFGPSKKSGGKKTKAVGAADGIRNAATSTESSSVTEDEIFTTDIETATSTSPGMMGKDWSASQPELSDKVEKARGKPKDRTELEASSRIPFFPTSKQIHSPPRPSSETVNRYKKNEPNNKFPATKLTDNRGTAARDTFRSQTQFSDYRRPQRGEPEEVGTGASTFRNSRMHPNNISRQEPIHPTSPTSSASGFGIFSATNTSAKQDVAEGNRKGDRPTSPTSSASGYGIFSATNSSGKQSVAEGNNKKER